MTAAIIIGTGPSLLNDANHVRKLKRKGKAKLFGVNNTFNDFDLDAWVATDPEWHQLNGKVVGNFDKWHWSEDVCAQYGYNYIKGVWMDGLSTDLNQISRGHSSGWLALGLAVHYGCEPICLVGHDMTYREGESRHYFTGLSDEDGEYPESIRKTCKWAKPDGTGLRLFYENIAIQKGLPKIINCTIGSAMTYFPIKPLSEVIP